jgi:hypothetical protein
MKATSTSQGTLPSSPSAPPGAKGAAIPQEWLEEFEAAARRTLAQRIRYGFIKTYKPVMDDEPFRSFNTMEDYRRWCEEKLPDWLGYGRV